MRRLDVALAAALTIMAFGWALLYVAIEERWDRPVLPAVGFSAGSAVVESPAEPKRVASVRTTGARPPTRPTYPTMPGVTGWRREALIKQVAGFGPMPPVQSTGRTVTRIVAKALLAAPAAAAGPPWRVDCSKVQHIGAGGGLSYDLLTWRAAPKRPGPWHVTAKTDNSVTVGDMTWQENPRAWPGTPYTIGWTAHLQRAVYYTVVEPDGTVWSADLNTGQNNLCDWR